MLEIIEKIIFEFVEIQKRPLTEIRLSPVAFRALGDEVNFKLKLVSEEQKNATTILVKSIPVVSSDVIGTSENVIDIKIIFETT